MDQCLEAYRHIIYDDDELRAAKDAKEVINIILERMSDDEYAQHEKERAQLFLEGGPCFPHVETILHVIREQIQLSQQLTLSASQSHGDQKLHYLVQALQSDASNIKASKMLSQFVKDLALEQDCNEQVMQIIYKVQNMLLPQHFAFLLNNITFLGQGGESSRWDIAKELFERSKDNIGIIKTVMITNRAILLGNRYLHMNMTSMKDNDEEFDSYTDKAKFQHKVRLSPRLYDTFTVSPWLSKNKLMQRLYDNWFAAVYEMSDSITSPTPEMVVQAAYLELIWYNGTKKRYPLGDIDNSHAWDHNEMSEDEDVLFRKRSFEQGVPQAKRPRAY